MNLHNIQKSNIPKSSGCYQFLDKQGRVIYIGKAANLKSRVLSYWQKNTAHSPAKHAMLKQVAKVQWTETDSEVEALLLEANLIKKYQPRFNVAMRDDKRYIYIKISTEDEWPRIFITRKLEKAGRYFGPFVSVEAVRQTLKAIKKIWPYRSCARLPKKVCLYWRIGKCPGMCEDKITKQEYKNIIRQISLFLQGKKEKIIKKLAQLQLANIHQVLSHTNVISVSEKYAADVVELAKVLNLPQIPQRIEGYDISNIFGQQAVGSMVVFSNGEPDKSEYRKFKIRLSEGQANDVKMLKEVLERRLKRACPHPPVCAGRHPLPRYVPCRRGELKRNGLQRVPLSRDVRSGRGARGEGKWPLPDFIIVDGGRAQLNVALRVLKKFKIDVPVIAVSKGRGLHSSVAPDKIFFPGEKKPLELPLASPALHIIKRVRDEAHRFAIGYHRQLRKKKYIQ